MTFPRRSRARPPVLRALRVAFGLALAALLASAAVALAEHETAWFLIALGLAVASGLAGWALLAWLRAEARDEMALRQELRRLNRDAFRASQD